MAHETVALLTADGPCDTAVFEPPGRGTRSALIFLADGGGPRPSQFEMAERMSAHGYLVVMPDLFHRLAPYDPREIFSLLRSVEGRARWRETFHASATGEANFDADLGAVLDHLAARGDVHPAVGTTGYCMGGNLSLRAAGRFPDRVAAAASFHGGGLASDAPDSPHRLAGRIKARVYVAGAIEDQSFPDEMKARLEAALTDAHVNHTVETYQAKHGWVFRDTPVYDAAAAERHWQTLLALFDATL
jgi:carboxymethylenebutenolidase